LIVEAIRNGLQFVSDDVVLISLAERGFIETIFSMIALSHGVDSSPYLIDIAN